MRIIHLAGDLGLGGIERVVQRLALAQRAAGWEVGVISTRGGGLVADELASQGIPVDNLALSAAGGWGAVPALISRFRARKPFLLHAHGVIGPAGRLAGRLAGADAIVQHLHGTDSYGPGRRAFERLLPADIYLAISKAVADDFERQTGIRPEVLHNPVDTKQFQWSSESSARGRTLLGASEGSPVVTLMGRFVPSKAQGVLVEAMPEVLARHPKALFVFIGDGPLKKEIEAKAERFGGAARFLGAQNDPVPYLNASTVYVQPSVDREGVCLAVLEAMSCARPIVASKVEGLPEAVGDAGELIPSKDAGALAGAINALLDEPARREDLGARARERVQAEFSLSSISKTLDALYKKLGAAR